MIRRWLAFLQEAWNGGLVAPTPRGRSGDADEIVVDATRSCDACGARHRFVVRRTRTRPLHSPVKENLTLPCRACAHPFLPWVDSDGESFTLTLESAEPPASP